MKLTPKAYGCTVERFPLEKEIPHDASTTDAPPRINTCDACAPNTTVTCTVTSQIIESELVSEEGSSKL